MSRFLFPFVSVLLLAAAIGGYAYLVLGTYAAAAVAAAAGEDIAATGRQQSLQQSIAAFMQNTETERAALARYVTTDSDVVSLIGEIEAAAKRDKVAVSIGSIAVGTADWKYHEPLDMTLSAQGSFAALAAFATELESLPVASHLVTLSVEASANHSWFGTFTLEFVKVKSANESVQPASSAAPAAPPASGGSALPAPDAP